MNIKKYQFWEASRKLKNELIWESIATQPFNVLFLKQILCSQPLSVEKIYNMPFFVNSNYEFSEPQYQFLKLIHKKNAVK